MLLREYCTPYPKISMFCALSQNYQHLFEKSPAPCTFSNLPHPHFFSTSRTPHFFQPPAPRTFLTSRTPHFFQPPAPRNFFNLPHPAICSTSRTPQFFKNCGVREVEKSAGCGRLKKVRGAGGWKNCGVREVEKTAGCRRLKNCGVREVEKSAGCGRLKKLQVLEVEKIAGWVKKLRGAWKNCGVQGRWVKNCRADEKLQGRWNLQRGWKVVGAEIRWSISLHVNWELIQGELSHWHSKQNLLILVLVVPDEDTSCRCSDSQLHAISF